LSLLHNRSHSRQAGGEERVRERWRGEEGRGEETEGRKQRRGGETEEERMDKWTINKQNLSVTTG